MALTRKEYTGDGTTTLINVDFDLGYIDKDYVHVYLEGKEIGDQIDYVWRNSNQIELINPVEIGLKFFVRRVVPRDQLVNDYEDGALLREGNLNDSYLQALMILEEIQDGFITVDDEFLILAKILVSQDLDLQGFNVKNLGYPQDVDDAVSKAYIEGRIKNLQDISSDTGLTVNLVAHGLSGNYGLFSKGFTYNSEGDVGIDDNGVIWKYIGSIPFTVEPNTVPTEGLYTSVDLASAVNIKDGYGGNLQNILDSGMTFKTVEDFKNASNIGDLLGNTITIKERDAKFLIVLTSNVSPNGKSVINNTVDTTYSAKVDTSSGKITFESCGAVPSGFNDTPTDSYSAMQAALDLRVSVEMGDSLSYGTSQELMINNGDFEARLPYCNGLARIVAVGTSGAFVGNSVLEIRNGSGELNLRKIEGIEFEGFADKSVEGLEFKGAGGIRGYRMNFNNFNSGVLFSNDVGSGTFTEGVIIYDSRFKNCNNPVEYYRGAGNDSFHGTGIVNCWINTTAGNPAIKIGDGCLPYNSPFDATVFADDGNGSYLFSAFGTTELRPPSFKGFISTEGEVSTLAKGDRDINFAGCVTGLGLQEFGRLYLCDSTRSNGPEGGNIRSSRRLKPITKRKNIAESGTKVYVCDINSTASVTITATGLGVVVDLACSKDETGNNPVMSPPVIYREFGGTLFGGLSMAVDALGIFIITNTDNTKVLYRQESKPNFSGNQYADYTEEL